MPHDFEQGLNSCQSETLQSTAWSTVHCIILAGVGEVAAHSDLLMNVVFLPIKLTQATALIMFPTLLLFSEIQPLQFDIIH